MTINSGRERFVQVTETHTMKGNDTVSDASQCIDVLPNGWKLCSLDYQDGWWVAVVRGGRLAVEK